MASDLAREALEPFAKAAEFFADEHEWRDHDGVMVAPVENYLEVHRCTVGDLRRARTAYDAIGSGVKADSEEQIARAILPTVWQMFDEYGGRLNPSAEADRKGSLAQARRVLSCLSTHTAAGAGPVGEAVAFTSRGQLDALKRGSVATMAGKGDEFFDVPLYARPVEEPGEVERKLRERLEKVEAALREIAEPGVGAAADWSLEECERYWFNQTRSQRAAARAALTGDAQEAAR